jgi:uncharacterized membrane protein
MSTSSSFPGSSLRARLRAPLVALVLAIALPVPAAAHGMHERLSPEERARLRDELRLRALEARRESSGERHHPASWGSPEGWHRLSPEERRELRLMLREERRRRHLPAPESGAAMRPPPEAEPAR